MSCEDTFSVLDVRGDSVLIGKECRAGTLPRGGSQYVPRCGRERGLLSPEAPGPPCSVPSPGNPVLEDKCVFPQGSRSTQVKASCWKQKPEGARRGSQSQSSVPAGVAGPGAQGRAVRARVCVREHEPASVCMSAHGRAPVSLGVCVHGGRTTLGTCTLPWTRSGAAPGPAPSPASPGDLCFLTFVLRGLPSLLVIRLLCRVWSGHRQGWRGALTTRGPWDLG